MVRVWYEPPPGGPRTHLNRGGYYSESAQMPTFLKRWSKMNPVVAIGAPVVVMTLMCYIPLMGHKLPATFDPEYQAATRAYMRYHNMNPIFGISSKKARAADGEH